MRQEAARGRTPGRATAPSDDPRSRLPSGARRTRAGALQRRLEHPAVPDGRRPRARAGARGQPVAGAGPRAARAGRCRPSRAPGCRPPTSTRPLTSPGMEDAVAADPGPRRARHADHGPRRLRRRRGLRHGDPRAGAAGLGAEPDWHLPSRTEDGYGLSAATVDRLAARGTGLLLTADCAITAVEEVARARAAGMDVVVTDHHQPRADGALPDAPVVHPAWAATRARTCARPASRTSWRWRC